MRDPACIVSYIRSTGARGISGAFIPCNDFAHPIGDALEGISHSLCSLEYEIHRPLYDWVVEHSQNMLPARPRQLEFCPAEHDARTVMSKRYLRPLVRRVAMCAAGMIPVCPP